LPVAGKLPILGNEHTTWISDDRHSRAYEVLFAERSNRIVRNLAGGRDGYPPASEDARCLACHTTPRRADLLAATSWMHQDGVGCEACHGASARWLAFHTTYDWQQLDRRQKEAFGFVDTKSLASRARACAGCHVGDSSTSELVARDVNHDLIAAGHPRLNFELSAYLDNMPPHWKEKDENGDPMAPSGRAANFPARAWAIGQLATALASLELLDSRAKAKGPSWPEFAEYGCFACHHDLRDEESRRQRPGAPARSVAAWGSWPMPMTRDLARGFIADPAAGRFSESFDELAKLMAQFAPDRKLVASKCRKTVESLNQCLEVLAQKPFDGPDVQKLLGIVNGPETLEPVSSWDDAAQRYLALVPFYQALLALDQTPELAAARQEVEGLFAGVVEKLKFKHGLDSPGGLDLPAVSQDLRALREKLKLHSRF